MYIQDKNSRFQFFLSSFIVLLMLYVSHYVLIVFFWILMVPVIVVPIVLTTKTVGITVMSAVLTCPGGTLGGPNSSCAIAADGAQNGGGTPMNITFSVHNPNYRSGSASFHIVVYGSQYPITPKGGWPISSTSLPAKTDTNITVMVPIAYYSASQIDPFFYARVWNPSGPGGSTQAFNVTISGSMQASVGSISTQNMNFNTTYQLLQGT